LSDSRPCTICGEPCQPGKAGATTAVACPNCLAERGQTIAFAPGEEPPSSPPLSIPLAPGTIFRGLRVDQVLGKGGMGVVHRARQISLERDVALKLLWPRFASTAELGPRFEREARLLASLNHPNIVHVYDFGSEGGLLFLTLEFVDGSTLAAHLKDGKGADLIWFLRVLSDVCNGLQKIHEAGLVHRDLKPANIFISRDGSAKIGDFGLAIETQDSLKLTQSGMFVGSPHYVSPEHVDERSVDGRSDLYALGVILFEGVAGAPPFDGSNASSILVKQLREAAPDLKSKVPSVPPLVAAIAKTLLAKNPKDRYPSAAELRVDLERAIEQIRKPRPANAARPAPKQAPPQAPAPAKRATPPPPVAAPARSVPARRVPWRWVAVGSVAASCLIVLLVALFSKPSPPESPESPAPVVATPKPPPPRPAPVARPEPAKETPAPPPKELPAPAPPVEAPTAAVEKNCTHGPFLDLSRRQIDRCGRSANLSGLAIAYCDLIGKASNAVDLRRAMDKNLGEIGEILASVAKTGHTLSVDEGLRGPDRLRRIQGQDVNEASLASVLSGLKPGAALDVVVERDGKESTLLLRFDELPAEFPGVLQAAALTPGEKPAPKAPAPPAPVAETPAPRPAAPPPPAAPRRLPVPDVSAMKKAEKGVRDLFNYGARTRLDRLALSRKLIDVARSSTTEDPAVRWVLLRDARELAAEALDLDAAFAAAATTAELFDAKLESLRAVAVATAKKSATAPEDAGPLAEALLAVIEQSWLAEDFEAASAFAKDAEYLARLAKAVPLADRVRDIGAEATEAKKDRDAARKASSADAAGCLVHGRYLCLWLGRWEDGLPFLEKGSDPVLKGLAAKEAARTGSADLAQAWWDASQRKERGSAERRRYLLRAAFWCDQAWPATSGLVKARIVKRLDDIETELSSRGVNLLPRMEPSQDSVDTPWSIDGARLTSSEAGVARIQIPYVPPAEYDLVVTAARRKGSSSFNAGLVSAGRRFVLSIDGFSEYDMTSIDRIDGRQGDMNETRVKEKQFIDERPHTVVFSVRRSSVSLTVDGRRVVDWRGDPKRLSISPAFAVPDERVLFLMTGSTSYDVTRLTLIPISGSGQKLR